MLTIEQFLRKYPDLKGAGANGNLSLVQDRLDEAALEISAVVFGAKVNTAHGLLTAIKLAGTPFGKNAKLSTPDGRTIYDNAWKKLCRLVAGKARPLL